MVIYLFLKWFDGMGWLFTEIKQINQISKTNDALFNFYIVLLTVFLNYSKSCYVVPSYIEKEFGKHIFVYSADLGPSESSQ